MDTEVLLRHLLRLRAAIDCAVEAAIPVSDADVYALVGLVDELDHALSRGATLPSRWSRAARDVRPVVERATAITVDLRVEPSNDNGSRRRRTRIRVTRTTGQLALPWSG
jgi:hypothetical protein